ncbi:MAG: hypothetical protein KGN02_07590 [bacterium]|nr:hypothetical protein [bacterium]
MTPSARDIYLASLDPATELTARRLAERSGIPDNDPLWLLLHDVHRSLHDLTSSANGALANEPFAARLSAAVGAAMTDDQRIVDALTTAIQTTQNASLRAIRSLESELKAFARKRAVAPFASIAFAFALAITVSIVTVWSAYHIGVGYGQDLGYRSGFHDGILYERSHK